MGTRHWHGYGWSGNPADMREGPHRRPPAVPGASGQEFLSSPVPPIQVGYWLARRAAASSARTWCDPDQVIEWLIARYERTPPSGALSYVPLETRVRSTRVALVNGVDAWWDYYTAGMSVSVLAAVCCPHSHLRLRCPLPPS